MTDSTVGSAEQAMNVLSRVGEQRVVVGRGEPSIADPLYQSYRLHSGGLTRKTARRYSHHTSFFISAVKGGTVSEIKGVPIGSSRST